jgi:hypothetical protein
LLIFWPEAKFAAFCFWSWQVLVHAALPHNGQGVVRRAAPPSLRPRRLWDCLLLPAARRTNPKGRTPQGRTRAKPCGHRERLSRAGSVLRSFACWCSPAVSDETQSAHGRPGLFVLLEIPSIERSIAGGIQLRCSGGGLPFMHAAGAWLVGAARGSFDGMRRSKCEGTAGENRGGCRPGWWLHVSTPSPRWSLPPTSVPSPSRREAMRWPSDRLEPCWVFRS